jgi:hypothetical protein
MQTQKMWREWMCDANWLDYGGTWYRHVTGRRFHFISILNWADTCGEREAAEVGSTYCVDLAEVDLDEIPESEIRSSLASCGCEEENPSDLVRAGCCHDSGSKAPLSSVNGNNAWRLIREAKAESRALDDPRKHDTAMERTVNKLGSTAAEYMSGDLSSALWRGVYANDPTAMLMLKIGMR